ncbi:7021_t:CDS:2, partial [Cetraspora pellucida]
ILKLCYNAQKRLLNKLLDDKRIEHANIEIPVVQLPKRNKNQSSKLKLWELCPWLSKDYFSKIKANFTSHLETNKITELSTWSQLGYSAKESWVEDCNFYKNCDSSTSNSYATAFSTSDHYIDPTSDSDNETSENISSQNLKDTLEQSSPIKKITDRISSRTRQKDDTNSKKCDQRLKGSLLKWI